MGLCGSKESVNPAEPGVTNSEIDAAFGKQQHQEKKEEVRPYKGGKDFPTAPKRPAGADIHDFYTLDRLLGQGGFGEVRTCTEKASGHKFAVKVISKIKFAGDEERENMINEVELMKRVRGNDNVVNLYETFEDKANFYLIMELCEGGELMEQIMAHRVFSEKDAASYMRAMLRGLKHCHDNGVVHRDLKPENFLFTRDSPPILKITDFGLSTFIPHPNHVITDACGSAFYIAPEVFTYKYTKEADVWSLGVILFLLLSGTVPFGYDAQREEDVYESIQQDELQLKSSQWRKVSSSARELVSGLLEKDPSKRYSLEQALHHPWVLGKSAPDTPIDSSVVRSMYNFNARNKFRKEALKMVASVLTASDVAKLRAAFHAIDTDNTGEITWEELQASLDKQTDGNKKVDVKGLMQRMDADGDGKINYEEFLLATAERQLVNHQNYIWMAFCELDRDASGTITEEELKRVLKHESPEKIKGYLEEYDLNKDGMIDYEEFMRMLLPKDLKYKVSRY